MLFLVWDDFLLSGCHSLESLLLAPVLAFALSHYCLHGIIQQMVVCGPLLRNKRINDFILKLSSASIFSS